MLNGLLNSSSFGITEIKLKRLLAEQEKQNLSPVIRTLMPPCEIGSITLVDQIVLLSLAKLAGAKKIIEIGTYLGYSSALFALNLSAKIHTIDLPKNEGSHNEFEDHLKLTDGNYNDDFLRSEQNERGEIYFEFLTPDERKKIDVIKDDSTSMIFKERFGAADMVFIDGGHDYETVKKDTINARSVVTNGVIVWHDFGSKIHDDVTNFLINEKDRKIFYVTGSLCAFEIVNQ